MAVIKDIDLWHEYVESVEKLGTNNRIVNAKASMSSNMERDVSHFVPEYARTVGASIGENSAYSSLYVVKLNRRERRNFVKEAAIDLHGFSRDISTVLANFCLECIEKKIKNIVIISGKGEGILKRAVLDWLLSNIHFVIGFFEIRDTSGESGAFGVKLRTRTVRFSHL
ncbi:MAG: Smr/MutS family protein [Holosporales bacterium]|jgi:DNA-nicking Smr family endonuclease|nr:Smr/MutS family protein [Holosporales bacterium]